MNTHQDYSFLLGVASELLNLFVMLAAWLAIKALWKMHPVRILDDRGEDSDESAEGF
jgi:hypothetical protein